MKMGLITTIKGHQCRNMSQCYDYIPLSRVRITVCRSAQPTVKHRHSIKISMKTHYHEDVTLCMLGLEEKALPVACEQMPARQCNSIRQENDGD